MDIEPSRGFGEFGFLPTLRVSVTERSRNRHKWAKLPCPISRNRLPQGAANDANILPHALAYAMQCLVCGTHMRLEQVARDDSGLVLGFEHHTFVCSACGDTEQRYVFAKREGQSRTGPAPQVSPFSVFEIQSTSALDIVRHVVAKLSGIFHAMKGRLALGFGNAKPVSVPPTAHKSAAPIEPVPAPPIEPASAPPIEPVSAPPIEPVSVIPIEPVSAIPVEPVSVISAEPVSEIPVEIVPAPEPPPPSISYAEAALVPTASSSPVSSESEKDLDECEALLRHAIEMVRGPTQSPETATVAETTSATPAELGSSAPVERSRPEVVVQIHHDSQKDKYFAKDTSSGLSVLGHQDSARLRAMCDRMGWQVIDGQ